MLVIPVQDFLKNNRGIDDGSDLPVDYMSALYDRIINNEIKMKVCTFAISDENPPLTLHMNFGHCTCIAEGYTDAPAWLPDEKLRSSFPFWQLASRLYSPL